MRFLEKIVDQTRKRIEERKARVPLSKLEEEISHLPPPRDLAAALSGFGIKLIAEVKRASPSKGALRMDLDPGRLSRIYAEAGAAAISILTEPHFFRGSFEDLRAVREQADLPLLCKDFILDSYQLFEARSWGADAVLLIARILPPRDLEDFLGIARELGMRCLVEVHTRSELEIALESGAEIIGVNNRDLNTFKVDLETTFSLLPLIPKDKIVVSESGIRSREDVRRLEEAGVNAILVGEALVTSSDPEGKIKELLGT